MSQSTTTSTRSPAVESLSRPPVEVPSGKKAMPPGLRAVELAGGGEKRSRDGRRQHPLRPPGDGNQSPPDIDADGDLRVVPNGEAARLAHHAGDRAGSGACLDSRHEAVQRGQRKSEHEPDHRQDDDELDQREPGLRPPILYQLEWSPFSPSPPALPSAPSVHTVVVAVLPGGFVLVRTTPRIGQGLPALEIGAVPDPPSRPVAPPVPPDRPDSSG